MAATLLWAAFAAVERRMQHPLLTVSLLMRRPSLAGSYLMLIGTGLLVGGFFLGSFDLQRTQGYSAAYVGLAFLPIAIATIVGAHAGSRLLQRVDARVLAVAALALSALGFAIAAFRSAPILAVSGLAVAALGTGATFVVAFTAALADAPASEAGLRSALVNTFHELGGAFGVAAMSSALGAGLTATHVGSHAFTHAFTLGAAVAIGAATLSPLLVPAVLRPKNSPGIAH